jgi:hypothetical protein
MKKVLLTIALMFGFLAFAGQTFAAVPSLTAKIEQPKSPTRINNLKIAVVTLDREGRDITVECYKTGTGTPFSTLAVTPGGNSVHCETNSSIMPSDGTYGFYAIAYAGSDTSTTSTVSVDYNTSGPGTPTNYSKEKPTSCTYKIKFKTADDSGNTTKVRIYRSENTTFDLNAGSLIATINIGSNTEGEHTDTIPVCDKTYYYALRAFDSAENASGVIGDSEIKTTTTGTGTSGSVAGTSSGAAGGAVAAGTAGNILGQESSTGTSTSGEVMGEGTPSAEEVYVPPIISKKYWPWIISAGVLGLLFLAWVLRKKNAQ